MKNFDIFSTNQDDINEIINIVCMYYAQLHTKDPRYKENCSKDLQLVADFYKYSYATLKNRKDLFDALYENGRKGWHKEEHRIEHRPLCYKIFEIYKDMPLDEFESMAMNIISKIRNTSITFFSIKTKDEATVNLILSKSSQVIFNGINVLQDRLKIGQIVFVVLGGDKPSWETGLIAMGVISKEPFDIGYDRNNFRLGVDIKLLLNKTIKRADLVAYKNTYDIIGIGPITKWEPNQALSQIEPIKAIALMRAMLDLDPSIANDLSALVSPKIMQKIKDATPMYNEIMVEYGGHVFKPVSSTTDEVATAPFSISSIITAIGETGLIYSDTLIKRFAFSLMAKRFLVLSGLAGSGKTRLALTFACLLAENKAKQVCIVSVGADWTNREPLLGFPNALQSGKYEKPENGVLDLLIEANKEENKNKPFFLILDEMNLSYVERYFADFLSSMESGEDISLWKENLNDGHDSVANDIPKSISLPHNLFIVGTINVDETTYMFSPKVLDRANVIEFKILPEDMEKFLIEMREINCDSINGKAAGMGTDFVNLANQKELEKDDVVVKTLQNFFNELKTVNAEFGYRSATEIFRFISHAKKNDDTGNRMSDSEIIDVAIVQKLLPKLHGSRKKLNPTLQKLWNLCFNIEERDILQINRDNISKAIYKESADKILRMYESANINGFTSFAEA